MPDDPRALGPTEVQRQACKLAEAIGEAAADLETNGPVSPAELRQRLLELEAEWTGKVTDEPSSGKTGRLPR